MPLPSRVSESVRRLNPGLFSPQIGGMTPALRKAIDPAHCEIQKPRIRQHKGDGMNKTERAFFHELTQRHGGAIMSQAVTFKLGNGVRYTPDFFLATDATNGHPDPVTFCQAWEVKGFMRDDAVVKLKVAAAQLPWINFTLVTKRKKKDGGGWSEERVHP